MPHAYVPPDFPGPAGVVAGSPASDVTVLEDPENLLAIVQGGRFHKRAGRLSLAAA